MESIQQKENWSWLFYSSLVLGITLLNILGQFVTAPILSYISGIYLFVFIVIMLFQIDGFVKYMSIVMLGVGVIILIGKGSSTDVWLRSVSINHTLVALFVSVPLLGIAVKSKKYIDALQGFYIKYLHNPTIFTAATQLFTHGMAIVLNMGAVSIFYYLSSSNPVVKSKRFILTALMRGFASAITWSPFFAAMALVMGQLHLEWANALPYLFGFVVVSFIVSVTVDLLLQKRLSAEVSEGDEVAVTLEKEVVVDWRKIIELVLLLLSMIVFVFLFDRMTSLSMPTVVILTAFLFPTIWLLIKNKKALLLKEGKNYIKTTVPLFKTEAVLFIATGFFSGAISETNFGSWLATTLTTLFQHSVIGISLFIAVTIIVFSLIGFHPIMLITLYVTSVDPTQLGMSVIYYAVLLLGAWGLATPVSPMTAVSHLLGSLTRVRVFTLSFRWNITYCIFGLFFLILYLTILMKMNSI